MKIIGHRGARGLAPENTIAGFKVALRHNVDEIEFDVRVTKDKIAILNHNPYITDNAGNHLVVKKHTYKELLEHKADLPKFETAARFIDRQVPMYIEVKEGIDIQPVITVLNALLSDGWSNSDILLGSKSQTTLKALHRQLPDIQKIVIERWSAIKARLRARQLGTKRISMNHYVLWWGLVSSFKRSGYEIYPYTLNNIEKAKQWSNHGLAGVITDFPDRFEK